MSRIAVVSVASRRLSQRACQSISLPRKRKAVLLQHTQTGRRKHPGAKFTCGRRVLQDNTALFHFWIRGQWDYPITPLTADRRRQHEREGNDASLSGAALYKF